MKKYKFSVTAHFFAATMLVIMGMFVSFSAHAMDKEAELHIRRLEDIISRVRKENSQILTDTRALQRYMEKLEKENKEINRKLQEAEDAMLKLQNTDISSLKANQQKLYDNYGLLDWGTEKRNCPGIGKHQQVKNVQSKDGNYTLRYLCFDGRALHLGTEVHQPPSE